MSALPQNLEMFGQRLVMLRRASGKTQEQVATHLGMSRPTYIAIEKGNRRPSALEVSGIAAFLGCQTSDLLRPVSPPEFSPHRRELMDQLKTNDQEIDTAVADLERFADDYQRLELMLNRPLQLNLPPVIQIPLRGGTAELAAVAEDVAGSERSRLKLGEQPVLQLREVLEAEAGVRICVAPLPSKLSGMYAFSPSLGCLIMVNARHPARRRRMSLAHEYGHCLTDDRFRPGIDYVHAGRKPSNERFADVFGTAFLMPRAGVRRQFHEVMNRTKDFQVADLIRMADYFAVTVQAMALRLEALTLIPTGTWDSLKESGLKPEALRNLLNDVQAREDGDDAMPQHFRSLAVQAFRQELISEGELARLLRTDRLEARGVVQKHETLRDVDELGSLQQFVLPPSQSIIDRNP